MLTLLLSSLNYAFILIFVLLLCLSTQVDSLSLAKLIVKGKVVWVKPRAPTEIQAALANYNVDAHILIDY